MVVPETKPVENPWDMVMVLLFIILLSFSLCLSPLISFSFHPPLTLSLPLSSSPPLIFLSLSLYLPLFTLPLSLFNFLYPLLFTFCPAAGVNVVNSACVTLSLPPQQTKQ